MDPSTLPEMLFLKNGWLGSLWMLLFGLLVSVFGGYAVLVPTFVHRFDRPFLNRLISWLIALFGAVTMIWSAIDLIPGANGLILTRDGFAKRTAWRERHERWDRVLSPFTVELRGDRDDWVRNWISPATVIRYRIPQELGSAPTCCIASYDGLWGHSNEDLAKLLNAWRARAIGTPQPK